LAAHQAHAVASAPACYRYSQAGPNQTSTELDGKDTALQEVVDMYFNTVGMKMNAFVLDELRLLRERFELDQIRYAFRRARQNEIRSLNWVVQQLVKQSKKAEEE